MYVNAGMPDCLASDQFGFGRKKKPNDAGTGPVPDQADAVRHLWSGNALELWMPALVSLMPMPSYGY